MEDELLFSEESAGDFDVQGEQSPWIILIVDDDPDVHETTVFSLRDGLVLGKPLEFLHAYSGKEAIDVLQKNPGVALVLLDAVMETEKAGLTAVQIIREELGMEDVRIILRTGQPGQVPELDTIAKYDINDYKTKNEMTRTKLLTAIIGALRSWQQIQRINSSRRGLEKIVQASNKFIVEQGLQSFAEGVITQMAGLFGVEPEGIVCASDGGKKTFSEDEYLVIAAAGKYKTLINRTIHKEDDENLFCIIRDTLKNKTNYIGKNSVSFFFTDSYQKNYATWIHTSRSLDDVDTDLLEIFCTNISLCANNIELVKRLKLQAWEDTVFKIPNMAALLERIRDCLEEDDVSNKDLIVLDIDGFYHINEMLGYDYGDVILRSLIARLRELFDESVFIARIASDAFAVLCCKDDFCSDKYPAITSMLINPPDGERELSVSVGVTRLNPMLGGASTQLRNAVIAMKRAKTEGIGQIARYSTQMGEEAREGIRLLQELKEAFANRQLFLVFQPQVSLEDKRVFCCEALLRWKNAKGEFIPPDRFIPLAEQAGLIVPMGAWVLKESLAALNRIHGAGFPHMRMAVNVSAPQLRRNNNFLEVLDTALAESGVDPRLLELEITESVSAFGIEDVQKLFNGIRERGISMAIDDFGTGYSSLSSIDRWPVDRLKIDRTFVRNMDKKKNGARLIDLVIPLGNRLSMRVLAEGVETEGQLQRLQQLGCHEVQGYFFSEPLELEDFIDWMKSYANN